MKPGLTLDAGALIALDRGDPRAIGMVAETDPQRGQITVPATALAQVLRTPARQVLLMRLLRQPTTVTEPLDRPDATHVGRLLATTGTSDIADAHVAVCARRFSQPVVTSDPDDIRRLDPDLDLIRI